MPISRRTFLSATGALSLGAAFGQQATQAWPAAPPRPDAEPSSPSGTVTVHDVLDGDDIFTWIERRHGGYDVTRYREVLGAANPFKEGDATHGLAAVDDASRTNARRLLANTTIAALLAHPIFEDEVATYADGMVDLAARRRVEPWTMGRLTAFLQRADEQGIRRLMPGLTSDVIACAVKLLDNDALIAVSRKIFNPLPGSTIGARGYMGARVQPNSPTDHPGDILMQVLDAFAYGVGDVVLGTNPVSSDVSQVVVVERVLEDVVHAFGLEDVLPHCVLAHVDVQAAAEQAAPGSTALWFQSLAGVADANAVFDISVAKMRRHAASRTGRFGLYFETGQGADATNGHGKGFDMVVHESRKYGFARALRADVARARAAAGVPGDPWVHVNDVAGFIGPEVFRTREQLVRVCLEDTVMGKLHGLTIGLDICSTLHMQVTLDDLDWCMDQVMPANPAYLMALPTRNDPMLSYLTTSYQDHVRIRERFGYRCDDRMRAFYVRLGVMDDAGAPARHFGDPSWVYLQYRRAKSDGRPDAAILAEAATLIGEVRARGVFIAEGHGEEPWRLAPDLDRQVRTLYDDARICLRGELPTDFDGMLAPAIALRSRSVDRDDYILHPPAGESLDDTSTARLRMLARRAGVAGRRAATPGDGSTPDVWVVISDGLNVYALTDDGHLAPFLDEFQKALRDTGRTLAPERIVVTGGRVRAGYRAGEVLYETLAPDATGSIVHLIGERPGNGHHTFSAYLTTLPGRVWAAPGTADHNHTRVVSNIADTALPPRVAARQAAALL